MQKSLIKKSDEFKILSQKIMKKLGFFDMINIQEKIEIVGSIKYGLALEEDSDVDIRISSKNPRESLIEKSNFLTKKMTEDKHLKKMNINNFFDEYIRFDKNKANLIKPGKNSKFFMIETFYYLDDKLEKKINFQIHIGENEFQEEFPELLKLDDNEREKLLILKEFIYKEMPFFRNRSFLIYQGFLHGNKTKETMLQYLIDNKYEKLIKK